MVDADSGQQDLKFFKALIPEVLSAQNLNTALKITESHFFLF